MLDKKQNKEAEIIGAKIKELRLLKGLTQEQLSEKIGIDNKKLSRIETGKTLPSLKLTGELNKIFNFDFYNLIENKKQKVCIPDNTLIQALNIFNSAKNKEERKLYLDALKHTQKCLNSKIK